MPGGDLSRKGGSVAGQGHDGDGFERYRPLLREEVRASEAAYRAQLTAAKFARTPREHRQGAPDLALEILWTCAAWPQAWQWLPTSTVPQLRQALSWV